MAFKIDFQKLNKTAEELAETVENQVDGIGKLYIKENEEYKVRFLHNMSMSIPVIYHTTLRMGSNGKKIPKFWFCESMFSDDNMVNCPACQDAETGHNAVVKHRIGRLVLVYSYNSEGKFYTYNGKSRPEDCVRLFFIQKQQLIDELITLEKNQGNLTEFDLFIKNERFGQGYWDTKFVLRPQSDITYPTDGSAPVTKIRKEDFDYDDKLPEIVVTNLGSYPFRETNFHFDATDREHLEIMSEFADLLMRASGISELKDYKTPKALPEINRSQSGNGPFYPPPMQNNQIVQNTTGYYPPSYNQYPQQNMAPQPSPYYPHQNPQYTIQQQPMVQYQSPYAPPPTVYATHNPQHAPLPGTNYVQQPMQQPNNDPPYINDDPWIAN